MTQCSAVQYLTPRPWPSVLQSSALPLDHDPVFCSPVRLADTYSDVCILARSGCCDRSIALRCSCSRSLRPSDFFLVGSMWKRTDVLWSFDGGLGAFCCFMAGEWTCPPCIRLPPIGFMAGNAAAMIQVYLKQIYKDNFWFVDLSVCMLKQYMLKAFLTTLNKGTNCNILV